MRPFGGIVMLSSDPTSSNFCSGGIPNMWIDRPGAGNAPRAVVPGVGPGLLGSPQSGHPRDSNRRPGLAESGTSAHVPGSTNPDNHLGARSWRISDPERTRDDGVEKGRSTVTREQCYSSNMLVCVCRSDGLRKYRSALSICLITKDAPVRSAPNSG